MEHSIKKTKLTFDAAHFLPKKYGKCNNLHGHTYIIKNLEVATEDIVDFAEFKKVIKSLDHSLIISKKHSKQYASELTDMAHTLDRLFTLNLTIIPFEETAVEYIAKYLEMKFKEVIGVKDVAFELYETPTSCAIIF